LAGSGDSGRNGEFGKEWQGNAAPLTDGFFDARVQVERLLYPTAFLKTACFSKPTLVRTL
jgi:hypothetical protein